MLLKINKYNGLIGIGKYPETYKPMVSDGSAKDLYVRFILEVSNSANVTLKIDPSVVLATKKDLLEIQKQIDSQKADNMNLKNDMEILYWMGAI